MPDPSTIEAPPTWDEVSGSEDYKGLEPIQKAAALTAWTIDTQNYVKSVHPDITTRGLADQSNAYYQKQLDSIRKDSPDEKLAQIRYPEDAINLGVVPESFKKNRPQIGLDEAAGTVQKQEPLPEIFQQAKDEASLHPETPISDESQKLLTQSEPNAAARELKSAAETGLGNPLADITAGQVGSFSGGVSKNSAQTAAGFAAVSGLEVPNLAISAATGPAAPFTLGALNLVEFLGGYFLGGKAVQAGSELTKDNPIFAQLHKDVMANPESEQAGETLVMAAQAGESLKNLAELASTKGAIAVTKQVLGGSAGGLAAEAVRPYVEKALNKVIGSTENVQPANLQSLSEAMVWGALLSGIAGHEAQKQAQSKAPDVIKQSLKSNPYIHMESNGKVVFDSEKFQQDIKVEKDQQLVQNLAQTGSPKTAAVQAEINKENQNEQNTSSSNETRNAGTSPEGSHLPDRIPDTNTGAGGEQLRSGNETDQPDIDSGEASNGPESVANAQESKATPVAINEPEAVKHKVEPPPELKPVLDALGARYDGIQEGYEDIPSRHQISIPDTGDTITVPLDAKPEEIKARIDEKRGVPEFAVGAMREGELPPQKTTGLAKGVVKDERLARGLQDLPKEERQSEEKRVQQAEDRVDANPEEASKLISKIVDNAQHAISADEAATLLVERNRVMNQRRDLENEWSNSETSDERKSEITKNLSDLEGKLDRLDRAQRLAGSAWGRTGHMYQRLIKEDYTLEAMERRARISKDGPLTEQERETLKLQAAKIEELNKRVENSSDVEQALKDQDELSRTYEATITQLKNDLSQRPKYGKEVFDIARGIVNRWKADAEIAHKTLRARLANTSSGVDPTILIDVAKILRAKIGEYGLEYSEMATQMIGEYGEKVIPYLKGAWKKAQDLIAKEKMIPKVRETFKKGIAKKKTPEEIKNRAKAEAVAGEELSHKTVYDLARAHINAGVHGEDAVMKAVHKDISAGPYPDATERDVRRAFSEYGKVKFPSKEADLKELSELRTLTRLQESIDRLTENKDALHSGLQRDKATQAIREKQAQLNELLKKRQGPPSPEKLASRDEAKQTALKNAIADLDKQLKTGEKPIKGQPPADSLKTEALRAERDAMRDKLREIEEAAQPKKSESELQIEKLSKIKESLDDTLSGKRDEPAKTSFKALSDAAENIKAEILSMQELLAQMKRDAKPAKDPNAAKEKAQIKALEDAIAKYNEKISTADFTSKEKGASRPDTKAVSDLREIRDARKAVYDAAKKASKPVRTAEEIYNTTRQKAIAKQLAEVRDRISRGDYTKIPRPKPPAKNPETVTAWTELQKAKEEAKINEEKLRLSNRTAPQRAVDAFKQVLHLITAVKIVGHGTVGMFTHAGGLAWRPTKAITFWHNFARQFPLWLNKAYHERLIYNLEKDPEFQTWKDAGASIDPHKTYTDYGMYSRWLGKLAAGGARGFDALKLARLELNKSDWKQVPESIKSDPVAAQETRKRIAEINNKATGAITKENNSLNTIARTPLANAVFFAPKLYTSRWTRVVLDPVQTAFTFANWAKSTPAAKIAATIKLKHAAEFSAAYVGALLVNQGLLKASGSSQSVNLNDPTKNDWLKFKAGGKEIVADGGLLDPVRLLGQIVWGDIIENRTSNQQYREGTRYEKVTHDLAKYVRGKLNPTFGLVVDATTGSDFAGRPLPFSKEKPKYKDQPKYSWGEWLSQQGPIPISMGSKIAYEEMRKKGLTSPQAMDFLKGAAISVAGMTGAHVTTDYSDKIHR